MKGCAQIFAGLTAVFFIITAALAMIVVSLLNVVTDRDAMKQALTGLDGLVMQAAPALLVQTIEQEVAAQGLPPLNIDDAVLETAVAQLIPPDWIEEQTNTAVDALYDVLETGEVQQSEIRIDTAPLFANLQGEPGRQLIGTIVASVPDCPAGTLPDLSSGDIPSCIPANLPREQVVQQVHQDVITAVQNNPQIMEAVVLPLVDVNVQLAQNEELSNLRAQIQQVQRTFDLARRFAWVLWLLPLMCLMLITLLVVRSLESWGNWWGWPLVATAVFVFTLTLLFPQLLTFTASLVADSAGVALRPLIDSSLQSIRRVWLNRVYIQAGGFFLVGLLLLIIAAIPSMRRA